MWILIVGPSDQGKPYTERLERLYREQYGTAVYIALSILKDQRDAEDAAADAITNIIDKADIIFSRPESESDEYLRSLLYKCARNAAFDRLRRKKVRLKHYEPENENIPAPQPNEKVSIKIWNLLFELPPKYKDVLEYAAHDMPIKDIAVLIDTSEDNVRHILSRGIKKLREYLHDNGLTMDDFLEVV